MNPQHYYQITPNDRGGYSIKVIEITIRHTGNYPTEADARRAAQRNDFSPFTPENPLASPKPYHTPFTGKPHHSHETHQTQ